MFRQKFPFGRTLSSSYFNETSQLALLLAGLGHGREVLRRRRGEPLVLRPLQILEQRRRLAQHLLRRRLRRLLLLLGLLCLLLLKGC